jgi:hypothetical protein
MPGNEVQRPTFSKSSSRTHSHFTHTLHLTISHQIRNDLIFIAQIEESLLILRTLGIQTTSSSPTYLSTSTTRFIPTTSIQDIFIHEAFKSFEVRFYLAIVVEGEQDVVVVFPVSLKYLEIGPYVLIV